MAVFGQKQNSTFNHPDISSYDKTTGPTVTHQTNIAAIVAGFDLVKKLQITKPNVIEQIQ